MIIEGEEMHANLNDAGSLNRRECLDEVLCSAASQASDTTCTYVEAVLDVPYLSHFDLKTREVHLDNTKRPESPTPEQKNGLIPRMLKEKEDTFVDLEKGPRVLEKSHRLFSFLFRKVSFNSQSGEERKTYPWLSTNIISQSIFFWIWPILIKGYNRALSPEDLWVMPDKLTVEDMHKRYRRNLKRIIGEDPWKNANEKTPREGKTRNDPPNKWPTYAIPYALFLTFRSSYTLSCFFLACSFGCQACAPLITKKLIVNVEYSYFGIDVRKESIAFTIGACFLILLNGILVNHFFHNAMVTGAAVKSILTKEILLKSFHLSAKSKESFSSGRITSLVSTDLSRIDLAIGFQPLVLCFPIPVIIAVTLLLMNLGVISLVGIGLFVVSLTLCALLMSRLFVMRKSVVKHTDERITLIREALGNLRIIKYHAWEQAYKAKITEVRNREMSSSFKIDAMKKIITAYAVTLPTLTSMVSFVAMWAKDESRSSGDVFSSLSLFSILAQAVMLLPVALSSGVDAAIGFQRCKEFLELEEEGNAYPTKFLESDQSGFLFNEENENVAKAHTPAAKDDTKFCRFAIEVSNANFTWRFSSESPWKAKSFSERDSKLYDVTSMGHQSDCRMKMQKERHLETNQFRGLHDINLNVRKGDFVVITGSIGSGKSSLLRALAGFMKLTNPETAHFKVNSDILLCSEPWIQNTTVRDNIVFGGQFQKSFYEKVLHACCLDEDIQQLSHGDLTKIGEKGVTLSGGQRARIHLARAVYRNSDILLLDDVLSAVDTRVARHITTELLEGLLSGHTRILATHQISFVSRADQIIFLNGDGSTDVGTVSELHGRNEGFRDLFAYSDSETKQGEMTKSKVFNNQIHETQNDGPEKVPGSRKQSVSHNPDSRVEDTEEQVNEYISGDGIKEDEESTNNIPWFVYKSYIKMGLGVFGNSAVPLFILSVALSTFCQLFTNTWLSFWMERRFSLPSKLYVAVYVILAVMAVFFTSIQFTMLAYISNRSALMLNVRATTRILHAPIHFMDKNPLGRLLNRFTKDTDALDNALGEQLTLFVFPLTTIFGIVVMCICYLPWFAIAVPFLAFGFIFFARLYSASSREIKKIEAMQRSSVYDNLNEILHGMNTIKAFKSESRFVQKNDNMLNKMNEAYFLSIACQRWLCVHLDSIAAIFALIVSLLCVTNQFGISASSTGLLLNYVIQMVGLLSLTIRAMTQVEVEMNSVERLHSYAFELPQEAPQTIPGHRIPKKWPIAGYIQFSNVSFRYGNNFPLVLKDLSFGVYPGEKIGICGRTGAGKSSLLQALYRLSEVERGCIMIDGIDISHIGLRDLRSKLSIIPQDPVIFRGTVRSNLDPFKQFTDAVLWSSLCRSGLIKRDDLLEVKLSVSNVRHNDDLHKFHLDRIVNEDGSNFSLGEKQLLALARAMVRDSKILVLDEATSSVDYETDARIQQTISTEFEKSTILCIAHRLRTILKYDRILLLDHGQIVEKGTPWHLYQHNGLFRSMCNKSQITAADFDR